MTTGDGLPAKLKNDAILEAVLEVRFEPDVSQLPEIFIGRFADDIAWKDFRPTRMASADIPAQLRRVDKNLRYLPSIEFVSPEGGRVLRIGPQMVSYSRRGVYPGWNTGFGTELQAVIDRLYTILPRVPVGRLGLRYINAWRSDLHGIKSIADLAIRISLGGEAVSNSLNLNYKTNIGTDFETMSRIASVDLAEGAIPENATVIVDIDVYTSNAFTASNPETAKKWVVEAHDYEKIAFFNVLGEENTERLREK